MRCSALSMEACLSNENLASTSVETFPGTMARISLPNSTKSLSRAASTCSSIDLPCTESQNATQSIKIDTYMLLAILDGNIHQLGIFWLLRRGEDERWVCGSILWLVFCDGCEMLELYDFVGAVNLLAKSPESHTTVCGEILV